MIKSKKLQIKPQKKDLAFYAQGARAWITPVMYVETSVSTPEKVVSNVFMEPGQAFAIHVKNAERPCEYEIHFMNEGTTLNTNIIGDDAENPTGYGTFLPAENDIYDIYAGPTWSDKGFVFTGSKQVEGVINKFSNTIRVRFYFQKDEDQPTLKRLTSRGVGLGGRTETHVEYVDDDREDISRDMYKDYIFVLKDVATLEQ